MRSSVGLIGDPVAHSLSPALQNAAFADYGLAETYVLWPTTLAELHQRVTALRTPGMRGANVTLPHKTAVLPLLDEIDPIARAVGAANTIVRDEDGRLHGFNTDVQGFVHAVRTAGFEPQGRAAVVLGAGGAARAVVYGLIKAGIRSLVVANRTLERAELLLADMCTTNAEVHLFPMALDHPSLDSVLAEADVLINATSVGLDKGSLPVALPTIPSHLLVVDLIYHVTPLLRMAAHCGARTQDGLEMLVQQGALAFEAWTGLRAPIEIMRTAAQRALKERT